MATKQGVRVTMVAILSLVAALLPFAPPAAANHGRATLNVRPESVSRPLDTTHTFIAELDQLVTVEQGSVNIDFENQSGVNDVDGTTFDSPDLTCTIAARERSCSVTYTGTVTGRDLWRVWIDHDGRDATVEADRTENRNEDRDAGDGGTVCRGADPSGEPDCTDVVEVLWGTGALDCDDAEGPDTERNTNPSGGGAVSNEVYTCTLTDATSRPDVDRVIRAEVLNGINDPDVSDGASYDTPDYRCTTGDGTQGTTAGACTITVTQNEAEAGTALICFWAATVEDGALICSDETTDESQEADGSDVGNDLGDAVEKTWSERGAAGGGLDAEPETATSGFGTHEITATIYDQFGAPFNGDITVSFEFFRGSPSDTDGNSPESPDLTCTTTNDSTCTATYSQAAIGGTDLVCVWTNTAPVMKGTNNNGTCDGEGLSDADDTAGQADAPDPAGDDVDVVQKIWQNPTAAVTLDCEPESQTARRNTSPSITCTATDQSGAPVAGAEIDAEATGVNDPDAADAPVPPDFSCVTSATGRCSFSHGPRGVGTTDVQGATTYRAWIDADNDNSTSEADAGEGAGEATVPGAAEPDNTDAVSITWTAVRCDIAGTSGPDRLVGNKRSQTICGLGGNDRILAGGGDDRIFGDRGSDTIVGHGGNDRIDGAAGNDTISGKDGRDVLSGGAGRDRLFGGRGRDRCSGGPGRDSFSSC
jgi:Ca2+-binding RTX toxin-like protein